MVTIVIDETEIVTEPGTMIIEAADRAGIYIPRFCYHKKLSIAANCRMCLVEVEKSRKPLPACATPVTEGMRVYTKSKAALESQRTVMEFLLINHPLDCPICDQGGQCELQDISMGFGAGVSQYTQGKRSVEGDNLGSLVATDMTRCIHCTRCVRFGEEVAGLTELGAIGRGENTEIGTYVEHALTSEVSGNIIDLCPVGALTSKPFRFQARAWEMQQHDAIAGHDCLGSNIHVHTRRGTVLRVVPKENESVNETWLSDRDRFSYLGLNHKDRLSEPMLREGSSWRVISWQQALDCVVKRLNQIKVSHGADQIAGFISPNATLEEQYLFQKLCRSNEINNIDSRIRQMDFAHQANMPAFPGLGCAISSLESQEVIFLIGSNIQHEQPLASLRIRQATLQRECKVICVNPVDFSFNFQVAAKQISQPALMVTNLAAIVKVLALKQSASLPHAAEKLLQDIEPQEQHVAIAKLCQSSSCGTIILGALSQHHPAFSKLYGLAQLLGYLTGFSVGFLTEGANTAGAWLSGCVPHRDTAGAPPVKVGLSVAEAIQRQLKSYLLYNLEPDQDFADPLHTTAALSQAEFVVAFSPYMCPSLRQYTHLVLPIAPYTETSGTFISAEGRWQSFTGVAKPFGEARPGWKVLRVLGNLTGCEDFNYESSDQIRYEVKQLIDTLEPSDLRAPQYYAMSDLRTPKYEITRITEWPIYRSDAITRRSDALQSSATQRPLGVRLSASLASELQIQHGENVMVQQDKGAAVRLPVFVDNRIPAACVYIPAGYSETAQLGSSFGAIEIYQD